MPNFFLKGKILKHAIKNMDELKKLNKILNIERERTKKLQEKIKELERFQRLTLGRELRMIDLKKEIKKLNEELEKYKSR